MIYFLIISYKKTISYINKYKLIFQIVKVDILICYCDYIILSNNFVNYYIQQYILSLSILLTYHFISKGLFFEYTKSINLLLRSDFLILYCWEIYQVIIFIVIL